MFALLQPLEGVYGQILRSRVKDIPEFSESLKRGVAVSFDRPKKGAGVGGDNAP